MANNTFLADINEILLGFHLLDASWGNFDNDLDAKRQLEKRQKQVDVDQYVDQDGRAREMAEKSVRWAKSNGYSGRIDKVWWTARRGDLERIFKRKIEPKENPTDVLVEFSDGNFLGLSAKSTAKVEGAIAFKNPGVKNFSSDFNIDLEQWIKKKEKRALSPFKKELPKTKSGLTTYVKKNKHIKALLDTLADKIITDLRDISFTHLRKLTQDTLKKHLKNVWLNVDPRIFPYYITVTGRGSNEKYSANVSDPNKNEKIKLIQNGKITFSKQGNNSIGVKANNKRIMTMRFKYKETKLASNIKLSGEPW